MAAQAQYEIPDESALQKDADPEVLKGLKYKCLTTGAEFKDAGAMLIYIQGKNHKKKLEAEGKEEEPGLIGKLEKLKELEKPHREKKKEAGNTFMKKIIEIKNSMTPEEYKEHQKKYREEKKAKIAAGELEPKLKKRKLSAPPFTCLITGVTLNTAPEIYKHFKSAEFKEKTEGVACLLTGEGSKDDMEFMHGSHWQSSKYRNQLAKLKAHNVNPTTVGVWDPMAEDRTPYRCEITKKTLYGYNEVKEHMQSDEFAEASEKFKDGCAICGFNSDDPKKVLDHYLSMGHFKKLHQLAYFGMDISGYYVGP